MIEKQKQDDSIVEGGVMDDLYRDERKILIDGEYAASRDRDKWVLTLAAGAFGLSLTFVDRFEASAVVNHSCLLYWSWICFGSTILLMIVSFYCSERAHRELQDLLNEAYRDKNRQGYDQGNDWLEKYAKKQREIKWIQAISYLNISGLVFFFAGIVLLCAFAYNSIFTQEVING